MNSEEKSDGGKINIWSLSGLILGIVSIFFGFWSGPPLWGSIISVIGIKRAITNRDKTLGWIGLCLCELFGLAGIALVASESNFYEEGYIKIVLLVVAPILTLSVMESKFPNFVRNAFSGETMPKKKVAPVESIGKNKNFEIQKIGIDEVVQSEEYSEVEKKLAKMESLKEEGVISHKDFEAAKDRLSEQARKDKIEKMNKVYKEEFENKMETLNKLHDDSTLSDDEFERAKNKATEIHEKSLSDIDVSLLDIDSLLSIINYNGHKIHKMEGKFARIYFRIVGVRSVPIFSSIETAKSYIDHFLT